MQKYSTHAFSLRFISFTSHDAEWAAKGLCFGAEFPSNVFGFFLSVTAENTQEYPYCRFYVGCSLGILVPQPIF